MSAIDWLSNSVAIPPVTPDASISPAGPIEDISVAPLGAPQLDAVGLLPVSVTGLPADLWQESSGRELSRQIGALPPDLLPSMQRLLYTLLLAELDAPIGDENALFLARLDKLLALGALDQAQELLERAGPTNPALFRRWFDVSLLTGQEDRACAAMRAAPGIAPTFPARIFCLARGNDWNAAALTLETGNALGFITEAEDALLIRFLDPEFADFAEPLDVPHRPSPLVFRMYEAIGTPVATGHLPLAYAQADLRSITGWRGQLEAAERLARSGAIAPNRLLGVYSARLPSASGGVFDRVEALQALDAAVLGGDADMVAMALPPAWAAMREAGLEAAFASIYGERLARIALEGDAATLALWLGLLSPSYETVAAAFEENASARFLISVARGLPTEPDDARETAITAGFAETTELDLQLKAMLDEGRLGEAILQAINRIAAGQDGDLADLTQGLAVLRRVGLEEAARRAAIEVLILGPEA
ncbi:hypothetical protein [Actibacterium mucosum]|uniref:hypothetical protein n=1 Tax=Actibacterium mucosum TaxID=1087332 RepID=UPI001F44481F|nr:hypothetical protein [Actibacterium mucosum]